MKNKCLVCGKEKFASSVRCKLCGMGIRGEHVISNESLFCCMKCSRLFDTFMETLDENGREELLNKNPII